MRAKRIKKEKVNKTKIFICIICVVIIIVGIVLMVKKYKQTENNSKTTNNIYSSDNSSDFDKALQEPQIMAYVVETGRNEIIKNGITFNSNISVYANRGEIENIKHNNSEFTGTDLNEEGTYVITMKPSNGTANITATVTIDTIVPTIQINNKNITGMGSLHELNSVITLKNGEGKNKFTKALLVKCNSNYEPIENETTNITSDLKKDGYTINKEGIYKIQLLDDKNNQIEFIGKDLAFKIR